MTLQLQYALLNKLPLMNILDQLRQIKKDLEVLFLFKKLFKGDKYMKKFHEYKKSLDTEKERIVALYGVDITKSLFHEYYDDLHSMDMKKDFSNFFKESINHELEKNLEKDSLISNQALEIYEKELLSDTSTTN